MNINQLDWNKSPDGLLPAIVQNKTSGQILMVGYMNREALTVTLESRRVTFFSRSKQRLWQKGETSGNTLQLIDCTCDCDQDALLFLVEPKGPTCHLGTQSCFGETTSDSSFLFQLENVLKQRVEDQNKDSYTYKLYNKGLPKVAQKVGEEAVETVIAAMQDDDKHFTEECADLMYHLLVLLRCKDLSFSDVIEQLRRRR